MDSEQIIKLKEQFKNKEDRMLFIYSDQMKKIDRPVEHNSKDRLESLFGDLDEITAKGGLDREATLGEQCLQTLGYTELIDSVKILNEHFKNMRDIAEREDGQMMVVAFYQRCSGIIWVLRCLTYRYLFIYMEA